MLTIISRCYHHPFVKSNQIKNDFGFGRKLYTLGSILRPKGMILKHPLLYLHVASIVATTKNKDLSSTQQWQIFNICCCWQRSICREALHLSRCVLRANYLEEILLGICWFIYEKLYILHCRRHTPMYTVLNNAQWNDIFFTDYVENGQAVGEITTSY